MDITTWRPEVLCLSSGSTKGIYILGALFLAKSRGYLDHTHTYIGSSVGAILEALMICGWTVFEILEHACQTALFKDFSDIEWTQITKEYGLFPNSSFNDNLAKKLEWMIRHKFGRIPTLQDLFEITKKRMIFVVVSLQEERAQYLDHINSPTLDLLKAMRMTSNIPGIFGKLEYQKDLFVDGALIDPFPIGYLDDGNTSILGIAVEDVRSWNLEKMSPGGYFDRVTGLPIREMTNFAIANASDKCVTMVIPVKDDLSISIMDNGKNVDIRIKMFQKGYKYAENFFDTFDSTKLRKCEKKMPVNSSVIRECLKSKPVRTLLESMRENPSLIRQNLSSEDYIILESLFGKGKGELFGDHVGKIGVVDIPLEMKMPVSEVSKPEEDLSVVPIHHNFGIQPQKKEEEEEEILEIPRSAFRPSRPEFFQQPFHFSNTPTNIEIKIDREMIEGMIEIGGIILRKLLMPQIEGRFGNSLK